MASASRRDRKGPKNPKMVMQGKVSPERFRYCVDHDIKMKAIQDWDSGAIQYECKDGCRLTARQAVLK